MSERRTARYRLVQQLRAANVGPAVGDQLLAFWDEIAAQHMRPLTAIREEIDAADISPDHPYALREDSTVLEMVLLLQAVRGVGGISIR